MFDEAWCVSCCSVWKSLQPIKAFDVDACYSDVIPLLLCAFTFDHDKTQRSVLGTVDTQLYVCR